MSPGALGDQEKLLLLAKKIHPKTFQELRLDRFYKRRTESFQELKSALLEKSQEDWIERQLFHQKKQSLTVLNDPSISVPSANLHPES